MLGRALTSIFWGMVADKYGRKPVIVISILSVYVPCILRTLWMKFSTFSHYLPALFTDYGVIFFYRIIFNALFGLSTSFWMAITTRALLGFFSGLLGPIKVSSNI